MSWNVDAGVRKVEYVVCMAWLESFLRGDDRDGFKLRYLPLVVMID